MSLVNMSIEFPYSPKLNSITEYIKETNLNRFKYFFFFFDITNHSQLGYDTVDIEILGVRNNQLFETIFHHKYTVQKVKEHKCG